MKNIFLIISIFAFGQLFAQQDIYDYSNSLQYGKYLFDKQQYELSANEFSRACFINPSSDTALFMAMKSFRLGGNSLAGKTLFDDFSSKPDFKLIPALQKEYFKTLLFLGDTIAFSKINQSTLSADDKTVFLLTGALIGGNKKNIMPYVSYIPSKDIPELNKLKTTGLEYLNMRKKSIFVASALSTAVPGLGKVYAHDWKDGMISFLYIGASAWGAYRGFKKFGVRSAYGWVFGSLTFCFYAGNIWGSGKAARLYNQKNKKDVEDKAKNIISDY